VRARARVYQWVVEAVLRSNQHRDETIEDWVTAKMQKTKKQTKQNKQNKKTK